MNLKNLKPVGGFYRYGFSLYTTSQHDLDAYASVNLALLGVTAAGDKVVHISSVHCGGHNLKLEEIVIQDGLVVFCDINRSWQVAFAVDFARYMTWLRNDGALTADQYEKELKRIEQNQPRINEDEN